VGAGSDSAEHAYRDYRGHVYRFLLRRTRNSHEAEELTQRVFADAASALEDEEPPRSLLSWLYTVAERRLVDEIRRGVSARRGLILLRPPEEAPDLAYSAEILAGVRQALANLPEDQRRIVVMKVLEGRSFAEIAREFEISEAACKMRLSRAITQVKSDLRKQGLGPHE
jgi:RNA polymerase sigma-70 factor (ECF subfamily)